LPRLKIYFIIWTVCWFILIAYVLWSNGAKAADPVPIAPEITAPLTCAFYSSQIKFIEPSKDLWDRPLGGTEPKQTFYGCMLKFWEVDELGKQLGGTYVFGLNPSSPSGGGTKIVTIPIQFQGRMIKATGFCVNGYGFGPTAVPVSYFVKK